ncbi:MAG: 16S rRNA (guanine(527)-N(7))-methyltransferase RsmG [Caldisericaceae bacterium]
MEEKFERYLMLLLGAPKRAVLMSPKSDKTLLFKKHIEEAKFYLSYIKDNDVVLDLGSGVGFPGIPLAIQKPHSKFYLLDRKKLHADFLTKVKDDLSLTNVIVINMEAKFIKSLDIKFDVVVARAFNRIETILSFIFNNIKQGGLIVLGKKEDIQEELKQIKHPFVLNELVKTHFGYIVVIKKL